MSPFGAYFSHIFHVIFQYLSIYHSTTTTTTTTAAAAAAAARAATSVLPGSSVLSPLSSDPAPDPQLALGDPHGAWAWKKK